MQVLSTLKHQAFGDVDRFPVWWAGQLLHRNVQSFRGGLVFKAHRRCVSLNSRLESNKEEEEVVLGRIDGAVSRDGPHRGGDVPSSLGSGPKPQTLRCVRCPLSINLETSRNPHPCDSRWTPVACALSAVGNRHSKYSNKSCVGRIDGAVSRDGPHRGGNLK